MGKAKKLSYAGRIFLNPQNKCELWINCGWYGYDYEWDDSDLQVYPEYDDKLRECGISPDTYEALISFTKEQLSTTGKPCINSDYACLLCCCTCGLIFCPLCTLKSDFKELERNLMDAFTRYDPQTPQNSRWRASLRLEKEKHCQRATSHIWVDSTGQTLILDNLAGPGCPPPGMNVVLTFSQPVPCAWPEPIPENTTAAATAPPPLPTTSPYPAPPVQYAPYAPQQPQYPPPQTAQYPPPSSVTYPPPQTAQYPPPSSLPPPYEASPLLHHGPKFCEQCGTKCVGAKFCGECGTKLL